MPAAPSSLTDPVIGQLLPAAQALGSDLMRLLPVLASVPDLRPPRSPSQAGGDLGPGGVRGASRGRSA